MSMIRAGTRTLSALSAKVGAIFGMHLSGNLIYGNADGIQIYTGTQTPHFPLAG